MIHVRHLDSNVETLEQTLCHTGIAPEKFFSAGLPIEESLEILPKSPDFAVSPFRQSATVRPGLASRPPIPCVQSCGNSRFDAHQLRTV
jgi:hypothetical protein